MSLHPASCSILNISDVFMNIYFHGAKIHFIHEYLEIKLIFQIKKQSLLHYRCKQKYAYLCAFEKNADAQEIQRAV